MSAPALDRWLPDPAVRTVHRRRAAVPPDALWRAAEEIRLCDAARLGRLVRWRIPGVAPATRFRDLFAGYPFVVLEEGERHSVSGLCGRIWTLQRDYPRLEDARSFLDWSRPGTVRVLLAHWVEEDGAGARLVSEARISPVDRRAAVRLRAVWAVVSPFERLIGAEPLALAARRAEARVRR